MQAVTIFGSNQGHKYRILQAAKSALSLAAGEISQESSFYETIPWGFDCDENFLNQVVVFDTLLPPVEFLQCCLEAEKSLGRIRSDKGPRYSQRPIDIDLLFYDSLILNTPNLILPHPRLTERNFVLIPLAEIMADFVHPLLNKTIARLLKESPDHLPVTKIDPGISTFSHPTKQNLKRRGITG